MTDRDKKAERPEDESGIQTITEEEVEVKRPHLYKVLLLNDDYTPMDFVVWVLQKVFHKTLAVATRLMLDVHRKGKGLAGVFPFDIARTKVFQVKTLAQKYEHPLECIMEDEES